MEKRYKWANPYEWLAEKAKEWSHEELLSTFLTLAQQTDSDTLQDLFQDEMDSDGYFNEQ